MLAPRLRWRQKYIRYYPLTTDEARMTFTEHLAELRRRIIVSLLVVIVSCCVCFAFANQLFELIRRPLSSLTTPAAITETVPPVPGTTTPGTATVPATKPAAAPVEEVEWTALNPIEPIWVLIQVAIYAGLFISLPIIIYQICAFVFPGLKPGERRVVNFMIFGCGGFALLGICVAYFEILPTFLPTLIQYAPAHVVMQLRMNETVSLILKFLLAFGIAFQFPMIVFVLVFLDLLSPASLRKQRRIAIVILAVAGAVLTPGPDPFSMIMMSSALYFLYEMSIWVSYLIVWRKKRRAAEVEEL